MITISKELMAKVSEGKASRYTIEKLSEGKVKIFSADLNDSIVLDTKSADFVKSVRAVGYLIDQKLGLKGQHQSRLWSKVKRSI